MYHGNCRWPEENARCLRYWRRCISKCVPWALWHIKGILAQNARLSMTASQDLVPAPDLNRKSIWHSAAFKLPTFGRRPSPHRRLCTSKREENTACHYKMEPSMSRDGWQLLWVPALLTLRASENFKRSQIFAARFRALPSEISEAQKTRRSTVTIKEKHGYLSCRNIS